MDRIPRPRRLQPSDLKTRKARARRRAAQSERPELEAPSGFIYFIEAGVGDSLFKIGITGNFDRRMNELRPKRVIAVACVPNPRALEIELHTHYDAKRLPGTEYFYLDDEEVLRIESRIQSGEKLVGINDHDWLETISTIESLQVEMDNIVAATSLEESPIQRAIMDREYDKLLDYKDNLYAKLLSQASLWDEDALIALDLLAKAQDKRNGEMWLLNRYRADLNRIGEGFIETCRNELQNDPFICRTRIPSEISYTIEGEVFLSGVELAAEWERMYQESERLSDKHYKETSPVMQAIIRKKWSQCEDRKTALYQLIAKEARAGRTEAFDILAKDYGMQI